ncbi:hypothetical protein AWB79_02757 [Caballeronia hypogeia]|uniref:Uncharacterized protein n=1 Tax=Caballeronia hypogeia TaxID=1777140 RepID=A0A158ATH9_9BURK|nr:hypothetical protein [Caballeronia hypogeia]SAK60960.1 hypothetical protein AWB79_02757 [Caballeronia hypogeia]
MKLAKVKIEYSSGTTIVDRVTLDPTTGQVHLAPRVLGLLNKMEESECSPSFSLEYKGDVLPVNMTGNGGYVVSIPPDPGPACAGCSTQSRRHPRTSGTKTAAICTLYRRHRSAAQSDTHIPHRPGIR